ncbi:major capsid protein [Rubrivivax sp. JA1026]|uniref:major capsid protein n=1 Tax=Rubrivivax sp. JA1026 TaxID=2710888 RepID=UPI0013E94B63|nr:major capsid protein [Rubrivivax sp. JA1026]
MDLFSTDTLLAIVRDLRTPALGLAARFFSSIVVDESEEIHFDVENKPRRISPFVSPLVAGKVVKGRGFATTTFKPAYIKDKRIFTPNRALKRVMGETIGGGDYTPQQRMEILLAQDLQDQLEMLERRLEWMAAKVLYDGKVTISGDDYPEVVVDFGRDSSLTKALASGVYWSVETVDPLDDLDDWSNASLLRSGVALTDFIMTADVWKVFRKKPSVKEYLDRTRGDSTLRPDAIQREGLVFMGNVAGFNIWVYSGWSVDPKTGNEAANLPAGTVLGVAGDNVEGVRHFGAILDHDSLQAEPYFPKSWLEQDPSIRYLLLQSAPLLVPYRVNATFRAKVMA